MSENGSPILVTGGTGTLGRLVVARLLEAGRDVRVLSRGRKDRVAAAGVEYVTADLTTGGGVFAAVDGIEVIVHCAGSVKGDATKARHLLEAASRVGVRHLVYISVVGDERVPMTGRLDRLMFGYFGSKLATDRIVAESAVPWTTLHATQFYDGILTTVTQMARLPIAMVPAGWRFQPVDTGEVAARLAELALGAPAGLVPELAGPRAYELADLLRGYLRATHRRRLIVGLPVPGAAASAVRAGAILAPDRAVGRKTWEDFLAERVGSPSEGRTATAGS
jgi:uncharacterized protein YbjT (DUF2867 family)